MIHIKSVNVETRLLPLSFDIEQGEVAHIIGPNGSGKSTLLSAIAGVTAYQGKVILSSKLQAEDSDQSLRTRDIKDLTLSELAERRAYLSQSQKPAFNLQIFQYLSLHIPERCDVHSPEVQQAIYDVTVMMNISDKLHRSIHELSGGEWQRVRVAATSLQVWPTINSNGQLLILDEPAAPLDIGQQSLLYNYIRHMANTGLSIVIANHDLNKTLEHADKVLMLKEGVKVAFGRPKNVMTSEVLSDLYDSEVRYLSVGRESVIVT